MITKKTLTTLALATSILLIGCKKQSTFTNSGSLPKVTSKSPNNNATNVALNKVISVSFSQTMDGLTINDSTFILKEGNNNITGSIDNSGVTATFTPSILLTSNTMYTVTLKDGIKNIDGKKLTSTISWSFTTGSNATGLSPVNLGTAENYVILAKTAINNNPTSNITGDIALSPAATSYITGLSLVDATGYATSSQITGNVYAADMVAPTPINLTTAVSDMETAYVDAATRTFPDFVELATGNIGGKTLTPGLYKWSNTVTAPTNLIISGSASDVWIFQIGGDLTVSSAVNITLSGGAKAENIFWQVAGEVVIGTSAHFEGVVLSMTGITLQTGATFNGRALAQTAVILDGNSITQP